MTGHCYKLSWGRPAPITLREDAGKGTICPLVGKGRSALSHFHQILKPLP